MPQETKVFYEFGKFRCVPREQLLLFEDKPVPLAPKLFEILVALIVSNGRLLTKDELMQQVWPDSFVEESNLTVNISALRKILGESSGGQQYIETVPKRGYRFVTEVAQREDNGELSPSGEAIGVKQARSLPESPPAAASLSETFRRWPAVAGLLLVAAMVMVLVSTRSAKLTDKDTVVLANFTNMTVDPVFDDALRQGLSSQLEQSPFLNLLSDDRIAQTLSLMAKPRDSRLIPEVAREVCQRTASTAVLDGAITQVGKQYLLTLKAINCSNGESLGSTQAQAADKDHVLDALGKVASGIRSQLGESLASVRKYDAPAENVTTPSLDALKAYSLGYQAMVVNSDYATAVPLFQRAIGLDPNFAMAYARMGTSYFNLYETERATESLRRAYELREHLSEREGLYIASHYEVVVTGNLIAARKVCELFAETYPREAPYTNMGIIYSQLGDYDLALAAFEKAVTIAPVTGNRYANLINGYLRVKRLSEALTASREAQAKKIDSPEIHVNLYWVGFLQHDAATMKREAGKVLSKPGYEDEMLNYESDTALYGGRLIQSRVLARSAMQAAEKSDEKEAAALYQAEAAVREALVGNMSLAGQQARAALALSNGRDVKAMSALALGMAGDSKRATRLADELDERFPEDTLVQFNYLPTIHAAILLQGHNSSRAVEALAPAEPYELGGNLLTLNFILYPVYIRGEAYLAAKQGEAAAAEFQKILDRPGAVRSEPIGALAHLKLGRAFVLTGDKIKAKNAYQEFLSLWKEADPDVPLLKQARAEYSKLD
jgi:eukaryotic-like serine/threonine-protein kinase